MEDLFETNKNLLISMLLDEGKLLTYVSISKDLCLHVNISKILLQRLIEHLRRETKDLQLNICYIISGATDIYEARTIVCSEQNLTEEKKCFKNIFYEHIYSVTKGNSSMDTVAHLIVNKFEDFALCSGLIKSKQCDKRTFAEIGDLKSSSQDTPVPEKGKYLPMSSKKVNQEAKPTKNGHNDIKVSSKPHTDSKSALVIKQEVISPKKDPIAPIGNNKAKIIATNNHKTLRGITGFFNKTDCNIKKEVTEKLLNGKETTQEKENTKVKYEKMDIEKVIPNVEVKFEAKKDSSNKILNQIKRTSKVEKKRKRVLHVSDSESDNENNEAFINESFEERDQVTHDSEDEIPPTPTVTNIVIKSGIVNPKKRRKVVDKTYTDEEGYILTKKVEIYESCSENEEEVKIQEKPPQTKEVKTEICLKEKTSGSKKKVSPPQKGKQPTLRNFFKKL